MVAAVLATTAVLVGAISQSVSGFGLVLVCGPLLVAALGPAEGVRLAVLLSLVVNVAVLARTWRHTEPRTVLLLLAPAAVATPLLAIALRSASPRLAAALAGAAALLGAIALATGLRWRAAQGRAGAVGAGFLSAAMNVVAGIGGPAIALYAANAEWRAVAMRSTAQAYFLGLNVVALASLGPPSVGAPLLLSCFAALAVGLLIGNVVATALSDRAARALTLALAGAGGAAVLVTALVAG